MTVVVDASVMVAALIDAGEEGLWAESVVAGGALAAPALLLVEVANELRRNLTSYDAWYVALAEALGARLATLDARLTRASGCTCEFLTIV